jgi:hypothetical protein
MLRVATLCTACASAVRGLEDESGEWGEGGALHGALERLLRALSSQLASDYQHDALIVNVRAQLDVLADWLDRYATSAERGHAPSGSAVLRTALCEQLIDAVEQSVCSNRWDRQPSGSADLGGGGLGSDDELFDSDDEELPRGTPRGGAPPSSSSSIAVDGSDNERMRALELLYAVAWLCPERAAASYKQMYRWLNQVSYCLAYLLRLRNETRAESKANEHSSLLSMPGFAHPFAL